MDFLDIKQILSDKNANDIITESCCRNEMCHLYDDYKMTFNEMRQIFRNIFTGKTILTEKCDGQDIMVTYRDGNFGFARNKSNLREPMNIEKLGLHFSGHEKLKEAFVSSANDIIKALNSIDAVNLNRIFSNGQNFADIKIVYPPIKNIMDYGNKCILQLNGIECFDSNFNNIGHDEEASKWLYETLKNHKALKQEMFEIEEPRILKMKDSVSGEKALTQLLEEFDKVIDGYSTKCTIQDYANERLRRCIINCCNHNNIEVDRDCTFVKELADRIGNFSGRRPTKSDICTFAKRAGVNVHGDDYRNLMEELELKRDTINEEIMRPVERLVMKAGVLLLKNLRGYLASDPGKCSRSISDRLETMITEVEADNSRLTPQKMKIFKKHMGKLENWKDKVCPTEGICFKYNGKTYKILGAFGNIRQILKIFGEK